MRFEAFSFGSIRIDGITYGRDVVIDGERVRERDKKPSKKYRETMVWSVHVSGGRVRESLFCLRSTSNKLEANQWVPHHFDIESLKNIRRECTGPGSPRDADLA